ncbi:MAG: hypothetical protein H0W71_00705 [Sphingomonas sp.]|nr:hypothetical protein [Sphingomonas sp.]
MRLWCASTAALVLPCSAFAQSPAPTTVQPAYDYSIANPVAGRWHYAPTTTGSAASFGDGAARPLLTLTCVRSIRRISIARPALGAAPYLMVWTSAERRNVPASFNPATGLISADLGAYDRLFDSLAFSRGRLAIGPSNAGALVAPVWPDIIRVIEDCRS